MAHANRPSLSNFASQVAQLWVKKEDHTKVAKLYGGQDVIVAPYELTFEAERHQETSYHRLDPSYPAKEGINWVFKVTNPHPTGQGTRTADGGTLLLPWGMASGEFEFKAFRKEGSHDFFIIIGDPSEPGHALYRYGNAGSPFQDVQGTGVWEFTPATTP
ncbi:hypothetical protein RhiJN_10175 [Ceratobasidium sp. AG-Ba]|nr:hypothetical protein RhiJN_10175 [Ceratobasidium sp. AG-Ba]QRW10928.1 hypothetical protein RhiLY_09927 [Ceratobasidium sp. AG-Ba]